MKHTIVLVKAFTKNPDFGNPAGIAVDARNIDDQRKQHIARELGFSESSFVEPSLHADYKVRFFTPHQEVDFCGHATVATFHCLLNSGEVKLKGKSSVTVTQETGIGVLPVTCHKDGKIVMGQKDPHFGTIVTDVGKVAEILSIESSMFSDLPTQIVSTGVKKLIVPVKSLQVLRQIKPNLEAIINHGRKYDYSGIAVLCAESFSGNADIATRNFSPSVGIDEDPATGIAAGPLASYAKKYIRDGNEFIIEQGFDMGKASTIFVDLHNGVSVGGYASTFGEQTFMI